MGADRHTFDSGVFLAPLLRNRTEEVIEACRALLGSASRGEITAVVSCLAWDEIVYVAGRVPAPWDADRGARAGALVRSLPGIVLAPVDADLVRSAEQIVRVTGWRPRDALHAATALRESDGRIVTLDSGYGARVEVATTLGLKVQLVGD